MLRFLIFLLVFGLNSLAVQGQSGTAAKQNNQSQQQTARLLALLDMPYDLFIADLDQAKIWADSMVWLGKKLNRPAELAKAYQKSALVHYYQGAYEATVADHMKSIELFTALGDSVGIAQVYIGMGYQGKRRDLGLSISQMELGIRLLEAVGGQDLSGATDNLGVLYEIKGDYVRAKALYEQAYQLKVANNDSIGLPYSLDHMGGLAVLMGNYAQAEALMKRAYLIRQLRNDRNGMAESMMYQADLYKQWGKPREVLLSTQEAIRIGKNIGYADLVRKAYAFEAEAYAALGQYESAYKQQLAFSQLNDSLFAQASNNRILQLEKKFQLAQKEQENQRLVQEKAIQGLELTAARTAQARLWWAAIAVLLALTLGFGFVFLRYQAKQRAEKALLQRQNFKAALKGEEKERQRIARELHDGVGQLLAAAKLQSSLLELQLSEVFKPKVQAQLSLLDEAVQEVRNISHNLMPVALVSKGLFAAIHGLAERINQGAGPQMEVYAEDVDQRFSADYELAVYRMVQEVLNNMLKHADASRIVLDMQLDENELTISIRDNGKGFALNKMKESKGIGWANLQARTDILGGMMEVESTEGQGTTVFFALPLREALLTAA